MERGSAGTCRFAPPTAAVDLATLFRDRDEVKRQ
jgi:hypothetical protein